MQSDDARTEALGDALHALSARLLLSGWLTDDANHKCYEKVVAAFGRLAGAPDQEARDD